jgi:hypothetical protein
MKNFERDLYYSLNEKAADINYAIKLYNALCNVQWQEIWYPVDYLKQKVDWIHRRNKDNVIPQRIVYGCSWRYAGSLLANIRCVGENYLDFYCSGNEGEVDEEIKQDLNNLGWEELPYGYE